MKFDEIMEETKMNSCTIYYESWQMQCCGTPFSVGDKVKWGCVKSPKKQTALGRVLNFYEEHHETPTYTVMGTVRRIIADYCDYQAGTERYDHQTGTVYCDNVQDFEEEVQFADGWNVEEPGDDSITRSFGGYIVELEDVTVRRFLVSPKQQRMSRT